MINKIVESKNIDNRKYYAEREQLEDILNSDLISHSNYLLALQKLNNKYDFPNEWIKVTNNRTYNQYDLFYGDWKK